ncbi:MAG: phenylacetate--CoA ligase family protein [Actinomycetota bacterium]
MPFHRSFLQTLPRDEIRALQEERLRSLIGRIFDQPVPFFKRLLEQASIKPGDVQTLDDLSRVPRIVKQDLRASEAEHPPLGDYRGASLQECLRLSTSTGTTGKPTIALFTKHDLEVDYDSAHRMFRRRGYEPGQIITHAHPAGLNGGAALLGGAIESFGALNVAVGLPSTEQDAQNAIRLWLELKPDWYEMFGPALLTFWETAVKMGLDPARDLNMPEPGELPPFRSVSAGLECFPFLGSACELYRGAHICEDEAIVECVDPVSGEPCADNERGRLVVTSLTKDNFLLRYDLEDLVRLQRDPCECGETQMRAFWDGREKDAVRVDRKLLLPMDAQLILREQFPEICEPALEFQMVRTSDTSALRIRIEAPNPTSELGRKIASSLGTELDVAVAVEMLEVGGIPRAAYKPVRVVDE